MMHPTCDARQLVGSAFPHHRPMIDDSELVGGDGRADGAKTMDNRRRVRDAGRRGTGHKDGDMGTPSSRHTASGSTNRRSPGCLALALITNRHTRHVKRKILELTKSCWTSSWSVRRKHGLDSAKWSISQRRPPISQTTSVHPVWCSSP